jgi:REP-associated tyrosine transposase
MNYPKNRNIHRPPHIYLDDGLYFITSRTFDHIDYFNDDNRRKIIYDIICLAEEKFEFDLHAWVILKNHYHLMIKVNKGSELSQIMKFINGKSSYDLNKIEKKERRIWSNYWDYLIRSEKDYYTHLNYIHNNLIKHGLVKNFDELKMNLNSSYMHFYEKYGEKWMMECFTNYPIIDYIVEGD